MSTFLQPINLPKALQLRAQHQDFQLIAGGTDLMVASKDQPKPRGLIDISRVSGLCQIKPNASGGLRIGASVCYAALLNHKSIVEDYPLLHAACREIGAAQIQSRGTLGGNIATASPVGDSLPALMALNATVHVASIRGPRSIPFAECITGYRTIDLGADELIVAIDLPAANPSALQFWRKVGTRRAQSISKVMVAAVGVVKNGLISEARISLGAVADRTWCATATAQSIIGKPADATTAESAKQSLRGEISPISDLRSTADYRLAVAENLVGRFVLDLGK